MKLHFEANLDYQLAAIEGLRLCVNQAGERVRGFEVNTLTVIAMESYERFAEGLQRELEADTGLRFGVVAPEQFAALAVVDGAGTTTALGHDKSKALCEGLLEAGYLDKRGNIQDSLRRALKDGTFAVPEAFKDQQPQVAALLKKLAGRLEVKNADERRPVRTRRAVLDSAEFKALWDRVKHKTTYRVEFDNERLILQCIADLAELPDVPRTRLQWRKADLTIGKAGVEATERTGASTVALDEGDMELPDLLTELQDRTQLTRRSIYRILTESGRLDQFERNPQEFIAQVAKVILYRKRRELVDGIKYQRLGDGAEHYYAQELFEEKELTGYLRNLLPAERSVYEDIVYDSDVEKSFAEQLHNNDAVKVYAKLPGWFTVPTPLGAYNPDWAVLVEHEGGERLYLVVETKSGLFKEDLREAEKAKTKCAKEHFKALALGENPARYSVATKLSDALSED